MFGYLILFIICVCLSSLLLAENISLPRVCIIGAGIAGLTTARHLKESGAGASFIVLEGTKYVGGTWRYDPRTDVDENGLPLHTSMYKHLRTNLPKPTMELPGFPLPADMPMYPTWSEFYQYLQDYSKHFDLEKHIKFMHYVTTVRRSDNVWKVRHKQVVTKEEFEEDYDFVVIGTGHYSKPKMPNIPGEEKFKGTIIHSHSYRVPDPYRNRRVLIIGAGPSGMDIGLDIAAVGSRLIHSHHSPAKYQTAFPDNYVKKPDVKEITETGVIFVDDSFEEIDDIVYCTGYEYHYPFLDESSELTIAPHSVIPLHQYMVNINQPTMVIVGLVVRACVVISIEAQARYTVALINGNFTLPPKEEMMEEWQKRYDSIISRGKPLSYLHLLDTKEDEYYANLTKESGIERVPPVIYKIRVRDTQGKLENLQLYRNYSYEILDSENFTRIFQG